MVKHGQIWSCYSVLNVLYSLIQKSKIQDHLKSLRNSEESLDLSDEFLARPLYRLFGYFSILGLLRVHVLLGDFTLALKSLDEIDLRSMASTLSRLHAVHAAHISAFYFVGIAYLFLRRYGDAIETFTRGFSHFHKHRRYTFGPESVGKVVDRMVALVAFAHTLAPNHKLDDWVRQAVTDKFGDAYNRLNRFHEKDSLAAAEELLNRACPKFLSPLPPPLPESAGGMATPVADTFKYQIDILLGDLASRLNVNETRAYLRLYTTLGTSKLAALKGVRESEVLCDLAVLKGSSRETRWKSSHEESNGSLLYGNLESIGDMTFFIDEVCLLYSVTG